MIFGTCKTCQVINCSYRSKKGVTECNHYYNQNINTLSEVMMLNENFERMVAAAPNCPYNEGQALSKWFLDCAKQWLEGYRAEIEQLPTVDAGSIEYREDLLTLITELLASFGGN